MSVCFDEAHSHKGMYSAPGACARRSHQKKTTENVPCGCNVCEVFLRIERIPMVLKHAFGRTSVLHLTKRPLIDNSIVARIIEQTWCYPWFENEPTAKVHATDLFRAVRKARTNRRVRAHYLRQERRGSSQCSEHTAVTSHASERGGMGGRVARGRKGKGSGTRKKGEVPLARWCLCIAHKVCRAVHLTRERTAQDAAVFEMRSLLCGNSAAVAQAYSAEALEQMRFRNRLARWKIS